LYYPHFGLKEPPFKITPNTDFFFSGGNRGAVLDALVYAITNGEGIIKVVGEVGSGKTMLCRMLQTILPEKIESIYLANPSVAPEDVLHAIAFELQLKVPKNADRLKVMQLLQAHLLKRHEEGRQVVIFVEEAQGMPLATLEEIRLLSNLETKQDKLLQIVLFGQPELDTNLSETHIRQLRERITHSFHLEPLGTKDIGEYLILRLRAAGYHGPHLFSEAAIKKLSSSAEGLARRVNILADKSLLAAYADNVYQVTPKHVKAAIQDSEFGRKTTNYKQYFIGASFLISLLAVATGYAWWQYQHQPENTTIEAKNIASKSPVANNVAIVTQPEKAKIKTPVTANNAATITNSTTPTPNAGVTVSPTTVAPASQTVAVNSVQLTSTVPAKNVPAQSFAIQAPSVVAAPAKPVPIQTLPINATEIKTLVDKRLEVTKGLLLSGQPNTITLQIKSLPTDAKLVGEQKKDDQLKAELARLSQQLEIDNIYLYRKNQNGQIYTLILYGEFAERSEALAALKNLPVPIKNSKPYLRTFAGINKDIEQTQ
jgi:type II secretory pathway predicted ATPase ExeA/septal ring-binding cell division protein DamX